MKLNSIKDITEESFKELSASVVSDFIEEQLKQASEKFNEEKTETETALKAAKDNYEKLSSEHGEVKEQLDKLSSSIAELEKEKSERIALDKFNERMASLDEAYQLSNDDRQVIATQIKNLDDESFEKYLGDMKVLLSSRVKTDDPDEEKEEEKVEQEQAEAKASIEPSVEEVIEDALDKAEEIKEEIPVSANASEAEVYDKYKKAFEMGNWSFNK
jgi:chromosome segregation ATPase